MIRVWKVSFLNQKKKKKKSHTAKFLLKSLILLYVLGFFFFFFFFIRVMASMVLSRIYTAHDSMWTKHCLTRGTSKVQPGSQTRSQVRPFTPTLKCIIHGSPPLTELLKCNFSFHLMVATPSDLSCNQ